MIEFKAFKQYEKFSFATPVTEEDIKEYQDTGNIKCKGFTTFNVSISDVDKKNNKSPKIGDMIAINPKDKTDQWLIEKRFFEDNHESYIIQFGIQPIIVN